MDDMSGRELGRLMAYLERVGFTPAQVLDCIRYVVGAEPPKPSAESPKA